MKTPNPIFKASEPNRQADGVSLLISMRGSVRRAVEPHFGTADGRKFMPLLALLLALTLPSLVQAQFGYVINNGAVTITGYTGPGGELTIPDTIDGLPVIAIGWLAFYENRSLTSVSIADGVIVLRLYQPEESHTLRQRHYHWRVRLLWLRQSDRLCHSRQRRHP